ncbi:MAG: DinB family protein [Gemmatimonadaceae bacterium]|nr:DinB family protein [Gemmatimonadaceae bacterium]
MLPRLRAQLDGLLARRMGFEADTRALSEAQLRFRPAEGAWSIAEVAQHVLHVEREVAKAAMKPGVERRGRRRTPRELAGMIGFLAVVKLNFRIRVPQKVAGRVTPAADPDMDELWSEWRELHQNLGRHLETVRAENLGDMAFKHPIVGPTSVRGTLPFLTRHFDHHMRQVRRIRRSPDFPRA